MSYITVITICIVNRLDFYDSVLHSVVVLYL